MEENTFNFQTCLLKSHFVLTWMLDTKVILHIISQSFDTHDKHFVMRHDFC